MKKTDSARWVPWGWRGWFLSSGSRNDPASLVLIGGAAISSRAAVIDVACPRPAAVCRASRLREGRFRWRN